jgi:hypothetical protein
VVVIVIIAVLVYMFVLRGDDGDGDNGNGNQKPYADFTYSPLVIHVDQTVTFDASNSTDLDGDELEYSWNFGDDNATTSNPNTDNGVTASHIYTVEGDYIVTLVVEDGKGGTDENVQNITVFLEETPTASFTMLYVNNAFTNINWKITIDSVEGTDEQLDLANIRFKIYNGSDTSDVKLEGLLSNLAETNKNPINPHNPANIYFDDLDADSTLSVGDFISIAGDGGATIQTGDYFQLIYDVNQGEMMAAEGIP